MFEGRVGPIRYGCYLQGPEGSRKIKWVWKDPVGSKLALKGAKGYGRFFEAPIDCVMFPESIKWVWKGPIKTLNFRRV